MCPLCTFPRYLSKFQSSEPRVNHWSLKEIREFAERLTLILHDKYTQIAQYFGSVCVNLSKSSWCLKIFTCNRKPCGFVLYCNKDSAKIISARVQCHKIHDVIKIIYYSIMSQMIKNHQSITKHLWGKSLFCAVLERTSILEAKMYKNFNIWRGVTYLIEQSW